MYVLAGKSYVDKIKEHQMSDALTALGIFISLISAYFAYKAYSSSKEITFPKRNARKSGAIISNLSPEAINFHSFISDNRDRKVYINILLDGIEVHQPPDNIYIGNHSFIIWDEKINPASNGVELTTENYSGIEVNISQKDETIGKIWYERGCYRLQGEFYIYTYGGPYQGIMTSVLIPIKSD